jgi:hypothetical protein
MLNISNESDGNICEGPNHIYVAYARRAPSMRPPRENTQTSKPLLKPWGTQGGGNDKERPAPPDPGELIDLLRRMVQVQATHSESQKRAEGPGWQEHSVPRAEHRAGRSDTEVDAVERSAEHQATGSPAALLICRIPRYAGETRHAGRRLCGMHVRMCTL